MKTITRAHLAEAIYAQVGLSRNESAALLETVLERCRPPSRRGRR
jgi:integration host factor subunit alpha